MKRDEILSLLWWRPQILQPLEISWKKIKNIIVLSLFLMSLQCLKMEMDQSSNSIAIHSNLESFEEFWWLEHFSNLDLTLNIEVNKYDYI